MITVLAGGVGAAKFLAGLSKVMRPEDITIIANTGDDAGFHGLHVSPDMDTVMYTLAGVVDSAKGWGIAEDSFFCLEALKALGEETWFRLGDRDLATHLRRTKLLRDGATLAQATDVLRQSFGVACRILPMTCDPASTKVRTRTGMLSFQEYFVKLRQEPAVLEVDFSAAMASKASDGVVDAIRGAEAVIVAPSNPILSIGPILAVKGIQDALRRTQAPVIAITPIVAGHALKGPAARNLRSLGLRSSATAVADLYRDFVNIFVLDLQDGELRPQIEKWGIQVVVTDTIMSSSKVQRQLAREVLKAVRK